MQSLSLSIYLILYGRGLWQERGTNYKTANKVSFKLPCFKNILKCSEGDFCPAEDAGLRCDGGLEAAEAVQGDPVLAAAEAQGAEVVGDLEPASSSPHLRPEPSQARRDLTISTLIAECEEYVNTDEFTKDLSDKLVHLFSKNKTNPSQKVSTENNLETTTASVKVMESTKKLDKPPKIPGKLRTKVAGKQDRADRERVAAPAPKFPVSGLRTSLYENSAGGGGGGGAGDSEVEDEGIDNDYDEAADTEPGEAGAKHETSPALASEGYDSAHESGEICDDVTLARPNQHSNDDSHIYI